VDQIAVAADRALHLASKVGSTVEGLFNGLHGEVGVATIDDLEDKDLPSLSGYFLSLGTIPEQCLKNIAIALKGVGL
jgi:hypothetical protein